MGGRSAGAHAPTPPDSDLVETEVRNCLDDVISLVMKRHYQRDLANARKKKKRKEKKEKLKCKKG